MAILEDYRRIALSHGVEPSSVAGIATEVFRKSTNGAEYLEQIRSALGFKINLISQQASNSCRTARIATRYEPVPKSHATPDGTLVG